MEKALIKFGYKRFEINPPSHIKHFSLLLERLKEEEGDFFEIYESMEKHVLDFYTRKAREYFQNDNLYCSDFFTDNVYLGIVEMTEKNFKVGDKCYITEETSFRLGLPDNIEYTIKDILKEDVKFQIVLNAKEFGKDWVEFFRAEELVIA